MPLSRYMPITALLPVSIIDGGKKMKEYSKPEFNVLSLISVSPVARGGAEVEISAGDWFIDDADPFDQ